MNEIGVEKWWNEIYGKENGRNPEKNISRPHFVHPLNPHGVTEMRTRDPSCARRATNHLRNVVILNKLFIYLMAGCMILKIINTKQQQKLKNVLLVVTML